MQRRIDAISTASAQRPPARWAGWWMLLFLLLALPAEAVAS